MSSKIGTIKDLIESLNEYDPSTPVASKVWITDDVLDYTDEKQALKIVQTYLDNINPEVMSYLDMEYDSTKGTN